MSRKRRRREVSTPISFANPRLPSATLSSAVSSHLYPLQPLTVIDDRRRYHPLGPTRGAVSFSGAQHELTVRDRPQRDRFAGLRKFPSATKAVVAFAAPNDTLVCVRRQRRKEVLHALRKAGKRGQRKPRRNWFSKIHC